MKQKIIDFYIDWVNNYVTLEKIAEDYDISSTDANILILMGKGYYENSINNN